MYFKAKVFLSAKGIHHNWRHFHGKSGNAVQLQTYRQQEVVYYKILVERNIINRSKFLPEQFHCLEKPDFTVKIGKKMAILVQRCINN